MKAKFILSILFGGAIFYPAMIPDAVGSVIKIDDGEVLIGDIIEIDEAYRADLAPILDLVLFRLKPGETREISHADLANLIVKRVPALKERLISLNNNSRQFRFSRNIQMERQRCIRLAVPVEKDEFILRSDVVTTTECSGVRESDNWIRYDVLSGTYKANTALKAGAKLSVKSRYVFPVAGPGDELSLFSNVGPVQVSRPVSLLDPVFETGVTHVRTSDGKIIQAYMLNEEVVTP